MKARAHAVMGVGALTIAVGLTGWFMQTPLPVAQLSAVQEQGTCLPGHEFTSFAPPALPGEWSGSQGFFAIPGTLELRYCRAGTLSFTAKGSLSDNGGAPMLVVSTGSESRQMLIEQPTRVDIAVPGNGKIMLAFPNDETNAEYRMLTIERLAVAGEKKCSSALVRDGKRKTFDIAASEVVFDQEGQMLEPCQPGDLYLTMNGPKVEGAGPHLQIRQSDRFLFDREVIGRISVKLTVTTTDPVHFAVVNFTGRKVRYRNLFISGLQFAPAP